MAAISYIGAVIGVSVATPATVDSAGFGALTYTTVGNIVSWGSIGDGVDDITIPLLAGRTLHVSGNKDGGAVPFTYQFEAADAGQTILRTQNNGNTDVSVKITDPDGKITYFFGRVAGLKSMERQSGAYKGESGEFRVNSATVIV